MAVATNDGDAVDTQLAALVVALESVDWHQVDGVSVATAAGFAQQVRAAREGRR